jgi:hypothetical protein
MEFGDLSRTNSVQDMLGFIDGFSRVFGAANLSVIVAGGSFERSA